MPDLSNTNHTHSDEVEDIISRSPSWLLRNSTWIITSIVASIIVSAFIFKYPEVINVTIKITNTFPSVNIMAEHNAQIYSAKNAGNLTVNKGDTLIVFENEVSIDDLDLVKRYTSVIENYLFKSDEISNFKHPSQAVLGGLKSSYTSLYLKWDAFMKSGGSTGTTAGTILYEDILNAARTMKDEINEWERRNVILSPVSGTLSHRSMFRSGQFISKGDHLFTIISNEYEPVIFSEIPEDLIGKINLGEEALIKLKEYPYKEFGKLKVSVQEISPIPFENKYFVRYKLNAGFVTTKNFKIPKLLNAVGEADIVLSNQSIIQLILNKY